MSILNKWSGESRRDFAVEAAPERVQSMPEPQLKELFFQALRGPSISDADNIPVCIFNAFFARLQLVQLMPREIFYLGGRSG
jgi:hypothetical protein